MAKRVLLSLNLPPAKRVIVGRWEPVSGETYEQFVPLKDQPPDEVAGDVERLRRWLMELGYTGLICIFPKPSIKSERLTVPEIMKNEAQIKESTLEKGAAT